MIFRSCLGTVCRSSRARVRPGFISSVFFLLPRSNNVRDKPLPTATMVGRVLNGSYAFSSMSVLKSRKKKDQFVSTEAAATMTRRKIQTNTMQGDEKQLETEKSSSSPDESLLNSVVEVFCNCTVYNKSRPWLTSGMGMAYIGSGFAISGKKIFTNAHVVTEMNAITHVSVKKRGGSQIEYEARIEKISHECDLAILKIDNNEFWEDMEPLEFGDIPPLQEVVFIVGYPNGIDKICITKGFVREVRTREYIHSDTRLLTIVIDATTKCGNSGGPVLMGSKVIGVLCSVSRNTSFVIPTPIIQRFMTGGGGESGQHAVFGSLGLSYQFMENVYIRNYFKMGPNMTGVLINKVNLWNDIILAIDGVPIQDYGTDFLGNKEIISLDHLVSMKEPGETVLVKVLRKEKEREYNITLKPMKPHVTVQPYYNNLPSYYIFGGFVFVPLTKSYSPRHHCKCVLMDIYKTAGEQQVKISWVYSDDINEGYKSFKDLQVEKVKGVKVKNLKHLCELIVGCCTKDLRLDLEDDKVMILNYEFAKKSTSRVLKRLSITSAISNDLCLPSSA
ncbi:unnamed protein product, partial [Thlaspi arvense]